MLVRQIWPSGRDKLTSYSPQEHKLQHNNFKPKS